MNEWRKEMKNLKTSEEIYGEWDFGFEGKKIIIKVSTLEQEWSGIRSY